MSIETLIHAHTEALLANTEAVKLLTLSLAGRTPKAEEKAPVENAKAVKAEKVAKAEKPKVEEKAVVTDETGDADTTTSIDYATVRALVLKLAPANRDAIQAINKKHGIGKLPELLDDANDYNTVNDPAKLEAVYADLQALEV